MTTKPGCEQQEAKIFDGSNLVAPPPEGESEQMELKDVVDIKSLQSMMEIFFKLTQIGVAIVDLHGEILVATGWQDICTKFHRVHPQTCENCLESDLKLASGIEPGAFRLYRCKNNMWDMATPITVGGKRIGTLYLGQFLFDDETPNLEVFRGQAARYAFDEEEYLAALEKVPRWSRETVDTVMTFYTKLAHFISELSYSNMQLERTLSDQRQTEKALRKSEAELRRSQAIALLGSWVLDLKSDILSCSEEMCRILQYSEKHLDRDTCLRFIHPEDAGRVGEVMQKALANKKSFAAEFRLVRMDGEVRLLSLRGEVLCNDEGQPIEMFGTGMDITERREMEEELLKVKKLESVSILSGGIAHDYNNLISMILGNISMAKDGLSPDDSVLDYLDDAEEASLKAKDLTYRLMALSESVGLQKKPGAIGGLLETSASEVSVFTNCTCTMDLAKDLWFVDHDPDQLKYAVKNVVTNGLEAMPDGGAIRIKAENVIISERDRGPSNPMAGGKYVRVSITDQGVGIPPENLEKIFDPYFTTKESEYQKGMGLGMAITYAIVTKHDGHISIHSKKRAGTTVHIYLPALEASKGEQEGKQDSGKPSVFQGKRKRILVMDDEELMRVLVQNMLKLLGYEVETASNGFEAIEIYRRARESGNPFACVILDLTVKGGMGGREAIKELLQIDPKIKAIVSSGYFRDPVLTDYEAYGFCRSIPKPYQMRDMERVLKEVLPLG